MSKRIFAVSHAFGLCLLALSCKSHSDDSTLRAEITAGDAAKRETILNTGDSVVAETKMGTFRIEAGPGFLRSYVWDNGSCSRSVELWPRGERWYGSYGIYFPGPGDHWKNCGGITRGVLEEGQMHFSSDEEAVAWVLETQKPCEGSGSKGCEVLIGSNGLVLELAKVPNRRQLSVSLFQVYVKGGVANLPGARSSLQLRTSK